MSKPIRKGGPVYPSMPGASYQGISIRDHVALEVLKSLINDSGWPDEPDITICMDKIFEIADAFLEKKDQKPEPKDDSPAQE